MTNRAWNRLSSVSEYDTLLLTAGIWFLAKFLRFSFPALFPTFRTEFGVSNAFLGGVFTATMLGYSLMQFPSGVLADRFGAVQVIAAGAVLAAAGALVLGFHIPLVVLIVGMLLVGLGTGVHKTVAIRLLSRVYSERTGRALGLFDTLGAFGGVAAPTAVLFVTGMGNWHALFLVGAVMGLLLAVGVVVYVPRRTGTADAADSADAASATDGGESTGSFEPRRYLALFRSRRFTLFVGVTVCFSFAYNGVVAFLPLYLTTHGLSDSTASLVYSLLFAVSLVQILTGDLSDRIGRLPLAMAVLAVAAGALGALSVVGNASAFVFGAIVVALGLGSHGFRPIRGAYLAASIPEDVAGGGLGIARTILMGVGALAPAVVGVLSDATGFGVAFGLLAVTMAGGALLAGVTAMVERRVTSPLSDVTGGDPR
ncbi:MULTISPECIES: MFS transporter [unclassified Haladaptatus]|uniref:MFS transporter n=1 Tax=unclassified Haladaptatus TaxID=2622732 RepID=UPI00209C298B|nr:MULTISPECIES: MFS transporter [unclassified Haladaptatus]MCO8245614.1 MFS transporter [Haladaptatus sp. AB643]MCO8255442.1 MFS transporter [Haladaptatus sp. AB618]